MGLNCCPLPFLSTQHSAPWNEDSRSPEFTEPNPQEPNADAEDAHTGRRGPKETVFLKGLFCSQGSHSPSRERREKTQAQRLQAQRWMEGANAGPHVVAVIFHHGG